MLKNREHRYSKNVTMRAECMEIIFDYASKTRQNFSRALDNIVSEWNALQVELRKRKVEQLQRQAEKEMQNLKTAQVNKK